MDFVSSQCIWALHLSPNDISEAYLSIPYAQPPVGPLRWTAPLMYNSSYPNGVLNASVFSPSCYQYGTISVETNLYSEDCLYLNVWAPVNVTINSSLPVKVWIYGGVFYAGSTYDPLYNGCNIATNAIVVTMNYRVGPLGWLTLNSSLGLTGNYGILDVLMALQWIQDNIASFGGNKTTVLLFGQSAGATIAHIISTLPQAASFFSSVIAESGAGRTLLTMQQQATVGNTFVNALGCSNARNVVECMRKISPTEMIQATPDNTAILTYLPNRFAPHVDGKVIPIQPINTSPKVPFMAGTCTMEGTLLAYFTFIKPEQVTINDYINYLNITFGADRVASILTVYPISMFNSTLWPAFYAIATVLTDAEYTCPTRRALVTSLSTKLGTYAFLWNHQPSCPWITSLSANILSLLGPTHTSEVPFVFGETMQLPPPNGTCQMSADEQLLSAQIIAAWQSMTQYGYPAFSNGSRWPDWSQRSIGVQFTRNLTFTVINTTQCDFWDAFQFQNTTNSTGISNNTFSTGASMETTCFGHATAVVALLTIFFGNLCM
ncbi:unnamed protein product [Rotaria magnacalcarata]|uniref:Carboxylic ester hydrolase n=1 Tax=Rotaria magnacalcarata TaxID=392030 RepID=A0A815WFG9_9BILA|nr:unnamed protein product [Rotaria magnacalcarata]